MGWGINISKKTDVDYQKAAAVYSEENRVAKDDTVVLPEVAGDPVVDYEAVSKKWKDVDAKMLRVDQEDGK